jgi:TPR repeat protein
VFKRMAGAAGDIPVSRQDLVVEQEPAKLGLLEAHFDEIVVLQRSRQPVSLCGKRRNEESDQMRQTILAAALVLAGPAAAEIETARDLMDAGQFQQAMEELMPAAVSGNAEAEELIGVMYALGLGVERDDERAFEWYLRAAMKGHAGAQSGVGWYYEIGRGMPAPDLVRAYMWYVLSAIGGDPDAAISQEEVVKKMTPEQIEKAHILVNDYKPWLYPFR